MISHSRKHVVVCRLRRVIVLMAGDWTPLALATDPTPLAQWMGALLTTHHKHRVMAQEWCKLENVGSSKGYQLLSFAESGFDTQTPNAANSPHKGEFAWRWMQGT